MRTHFRWEETVVIELFPFPVGQHTGNITREHRRRNMEINQIRHSSKPESPGDVFGLAHAATASFRGTEQYTAAVSRQKLIDELAVCMHSYIFISWLLAVISHAALARIVVGSAHANSWLEIACFSRGN